MQVHPLMGDCEAVLDLDGDKDGMDGGHRKDGSGERQGASQVNTSSQHYPDLT